MLQLPFTKPPQWPKVPIMASKTAPTKAGLTLRQRLACRVPCLWLREHFRFQKPKRTTLFQYGDRQYWQLETGQMVREHTARRYEYQPPVRPANG